MRCMTLFPVSLSDVYQQLPLSHVHPLELGCVVLLLTVSPEAADS